jgi:hypothetical protein
MLRVDDQENLKPELLTHGKTPKAGSQVADD